MTLAAIRAADAPDIAPEGVPPVQQATPQRLGFIYVGEPKDLAKLFSKMAGVLGEIQRVAKLGENTQQRYRYATAADLLDEVRPLLARHGIAFFPTVVSSDQREGKTKSGAAKVTTRIVLQTAFCCADTGAMLVSTWHGEAEDYGDKSYWKAYTGTLKYAHFQTWMVSTGDDPEEDQEPARARRSEPARKQAAAADPERTQFHTDLLAIINRDRKLLPEGYACAVGKTSTEDLKQFIADQWSLLVGNVELARKVATALDAALKAIKKHEREENKAKAETPTAEAEIDRLSRRYFARLKETVGDIHDADRHAFQEAITGIASSTEWGPKDFEAAIAAVDAGKAAEFRPLPF